MSIFLGILAALVLIAIVVWISIRASDRKMANRAAKVSAGKAAGLSVSNHYGDDVASDCADGGGD